MRQTFTKTERGRTSTEEACSDDGGRTWRWASNDQYCPADACRDYGIPADAAAQRSARDAQVAEFLAAYRLEQAERVPSDEERHEARAAFGAGHRVVDVVTGRVLTT